MTDYTTHYGLPYPDGDDPVVVNADLEELAKRTDVEMQKDFAVQQQQLDEHEQKTKPLDAGQHDSFRVRDQVGQVAFAVDSVGTSWIGDTQYRSSEAPFRIRDRTGRIALEVGPQGKTHIYDLAGQNHTSLNEWHVFLAVGQSNMSGAGTPYSDELDPEDPRILQYGNSIRTIRPATPQLDMSSNSPARGISPALTFAREYLKHVPSHVGVLLIPAARSGTAFTSLPDTYTWRPGAASSPDFALYEQSVQQTREALDAIGDTGILKGVLWHQGEGNAGSMTTEEYATDLDNVITQYRHDFGNPDLPFMVGQMSQERMFTRPERQRTNRAHYETPARVLRTGFAPSDWGWASYDETHFGRNGVIELGKRYVAAYWQALANVENAQLLPPLHVTARRVADEVTVTWDAPTTRVTGYQIRTRPMEGTDWTIIPRESPMQLSETFTATETIEIEVTSHNATETSTVVLTSA